MAVITSAAAVVLLVATCPLFSHAQTLVEYGAIGAKTETTVSGAAAGINRVTQHVTSSVVHQPSSVSARSTSSATRVQKTDVGSAAKVVPSTPHEAVEIKGAVPKDHPDKLQPKYRKSVTVSFE